MRGQSAFSLRRLSPGVTFSALLSLTFIFIRHFFISDCIYRVGTSRISLLRGQIVCAGTLRRSRSRDKQQAITATCAPQVSLPRALRGSFDQNVSGQVFKNAPHSDSRQVEGFGDL